MLPILLGMTPRYSRRSGLTSTMGGQTKAPRELGLARRYLSVLLNPSYRTTEPDPSRSVARSVRSVKL
jgi:hypothetical protein